MAAPLTLKTALRAGNSARLAFVGAGGKTTALFHLAYDYSAGVLVTTSTHFSFHQSRYADQRQIIRSAADLIPLFEEEINGVILLTGELIENNRISGLSPALLDNLKHYADRFKLPLLIEADGSRTFPLKAPADHEPAIPDWVNQVVVVAGMKGIGQPLDGEHVHRPELFAALSELPVGDAVTPEALVKVLVHPDGGLKHIPFGARRSVILNQADSPASQAAAASISPKLLVAYDDVLITALKDPEAPIKAVYTPVAGIILAAGGSSRLGGDSKMLLDWQGELFIHKVARTALEAGLDPVVVVAGAQSDRVVAAVRDLPVAISLNSAWETGQSSSIRRGLEALPAKCGGTLFLLGDQPQVNPTIIRALIEEHCKSLGPIIAPLVEGKRANPVLFDRSTFTDLGSLQGDVGGRALFSKYPVTWLSWNDSLLLMDVDTQEDYQRLLDTYQSMSDYEG